LDGDCGFVMVPLLVGVWCPIDGDGVLQLGVEWGGETMGIWLTESWFWVGIVGDSNLLFLSRRTEETENFLTASTQRRGGLKVQRKEGKTALLTTDEHR
jgi:hypothetical protein